MEFKTPHPDAEGPSPTQLQIPPKSAPFTNGVLKRHAPPQIHLRPPAVVTYRECLKNHAASLGGHAVDGCGEFMLSPAYDPARPTSLRCAVCGCHRNFHRREPDDKAPRHGLMLLPAPPPQTLEYRPHHRHHPPPPPGSLDDSPSPPPISSAYFNSGHAPLPGSAGWKRFRPMQRKDDELIGGEIGVDKFGISVSTPPSADAGATMLGTANGSS